jgi:UDP-N-acetylmuramoyl-tripeptide--D-alanyl-D-alanine ligase
MKQFLQKILRFLAKSILAKYKPEIIGITGSVGKSSTREAIYAVLSGELSVRQSEKNYNNELGVPLTIIGAKSANRSPWGWFKVILKGLDLILFFDKNYTKILILEMAADHPGDIKYLVSIAPCRIGIVTTISGVHLEFFGTIENIIKEKQIIVTRLDKNGYAILNADDDLVFKMKDKTKATVITYGFSENSDLRAMEMFLAGLEFEAEEFDENITPESHWDSREWGTNLKLSYKGSAVPVFLPRVLGKQQVSAALAGAAVGLIYGLNLVQISAALKNYQSPAGRMNLISGIKHTMLIDDTYNASPISTKAALETMKDINLPIGAKKIAVLGDMLELGSASAAGHKEVGKSAYDAGVDLLVTVGKEALNISEGAQDFGFDENKIMSFNDTNEAGRFLQEEIKSGDLILIKGSQGMRMERIVKELMAEPLKACSLLVRQDKSWECR